MSDDVPDPLAAMDQMLRGFVDAAKAIRGYYLALVEEGFTQDQALQLAIAWQTQLIRGGQQG